jgi:nitrite reductase (NO-forming)
MKRISFLFVLLVVVLVAAACGGGGGSQEESAEPEVFRAAVQGFDSFDYDPTSLTVPAGSNVTITLENAGALEHSWLLVPADVDPATVTEEDVINGATSGNVPAGESARISFEAPEPGTYQYVCHIPGHAAGGMVGTFTVEAAE